MQTLIEARQKANLSQAAIAAIAVTTPATLSMIENGKVLPRKTVRRRVESVLGEIDWLGTRLAGISYGEENTEVIEAIVYYLQNSSGGNRREKLQFLNRFIKQFSKTLDIN